MFETGDRAICSQCHLEVTVDEDGTWTSPLSEVCHGDNWMGKFHEVES